LTMMIPSSSGKTNKSCQTLLLLYVVRVKKPLENNGQNFN